MEPWMWWALLAMALLAGEILTTGFFLMWFGAGALVGAGLAWLGLSLPLQVLGFVAASGALVVSSRKIFKGVLGGHDGAPRAVSNVDALIDQVGTVTKGIDNEGGGGQVRLQGEFWSARSADDHPIAEGRRVVVVRVEGVKLIVMEQP